MLKSEIRRKRELEIITALDKFGILTAKQLKNMNVGGLGRGSVKNVLRVMREMERDGLVKSKRYGMKLFSVSGGGGGFGKWEHTLMRNDFLIRRGVWKSCVIEVPIRRGGEIVAYADAGWKLNGEWILLEVDRTQKKKENLKKIQLYKDMGVKFEILCYAERAYMWKGCVVNTI